MWMATIVSRLWSPNSRVVFFLLLKKKSLQPHWNYSWNCNVIFSVSIRNGCGWFTSVLKFKSTRNWMQWHKMFCCLFISRWLNVYIASPSISIYKSIENLRYSLALPCTFRKFAKIQISYMELCIQWSESKCWWADL